MTSFRQFRQILAENVEQLDEGRRSQWQHEDVDFKKSDIKSENINGHKSWKVYHKGEHVGYMTQAEHEDHKMSTGRYKYSTGTTKRKSFAYHPGTEYSGGSFPNGHHYSRYAPTHKSLGPFNDKDSASRAIAKHHSSAVKEGVEIVSEEEEKEYTVVADISHPFNRGLSVTKHFKHKAKSPEHAVKAAKDHIKSQGWKVHSASVRGNVSEEVEAIDLIDAIEEAFEEASQIDEISKKTLHSYMQKSEVDLAKARAVSKTIDPTGEAKSKEAQHYARRQFKRYRGQDDAHGKIHKTMYTRVPATD